MSPSLHCSSVKKKTELGYILSMQPISPLLPLAVGWVAPNEKFLCYLLLLAEFRSHHWGSIMIELQIAMLNKH